MEAGGEAARHLHAIVGLGELQHDLEAFPSGHPGRKLRPDLTHCDPEDVFSVVPYEKGHTLLFHLEQLVGGPAVFEPFLREYIQAFADAPALDTEQWRAFLLQKFPYLEVDWAAWFDSEGMPPVIPQYDRSLLVEVQRFASAWLEKAGKPSSSDDDEFMAKFTPWQQMLFLDELGKTKCDPALLAQLNDAYHLEDSKNVEILMRWYKLTLTANYAPAYSGAARFACQHGRMKYCRPVYRMLYGNPDTKQMAIDTFLANRSFYHPVAASMIAKDLQLQ